MSTPPTGTITFVFTDIEGSTRLWEQYPGPMQTALARHDILIKQAIEQNNGYVFKTVGDAFCAAFSTAREALVATITIQKALFVEPWPVEIGQIRVRMGLHTGVAEERGGDYFGQTLNRVARLQGVAYGGQVLLSNVTRELVASLLPEGCHLLYLGEHRLKDLAAPEQISQLAIPGLISDFPPLKTIGNYTNNLPIPTTSFIGRQNQIKEVKKLLSKTRLLTIVGTGGAGKTRLSQEVGREVLTDYKDGVWLVEMAALPNPNLLTQAIAQTLSLKEELGRPLLVTLMEYLKPRQLLLILDNCEHLVEAVARLTEQLLKASPELKTLATSREVLGIMGETSWRLPSLSLPDTVSIEQQEFKQLTSYEAIRLFEERTQAIKPDFILSSQNIRVVARICYQLDGIPLAIELASARMRALTIREIAAKLDDRFHMLSGGSRTALPRQQTLRALIDWSYDLLDEEEKKLFRRLSVFSGFWTLEAAEKICVGKGIETYQVLDLLIQLINKSLAVVEEVRGESRYRMLETIRHYARDRLTESGEAQMVRHNHLEHFLKLAEEAKPGLGNKEQAGGFTSLELTGQLYERAGDSLEMIARKEEAHETYRAALSETLGDDLVAQARLHRKIGTVWQQSYAEALQAYTTAETILGVPPKSEDKDWWEEWLQIRLERLWIFYWHNQLSELFAIANSIKPVLEKYGTAAQKGVFFRGLVLVAFRRDRYLISEETLQHAKISLEALQKSGQRETIGFGYFVLGFSFMWKQEYEKAIEQLNNSLKLAEELRDIVLQSRCVTYLGVIYRKLGNILETEKYILRTFETAKVTQIDEYKATAIANKAWLAWKRGDPATTLKLVEEAMSEWMKKTTGFPCFGLALWPGLDSALKLNQVQMALDYARLMLQPSQQRLPAELETVLLEALAAAGNNDFELAVASLATALKVAQETNYF